MVTELQLCRLAELTPLDFCFLGWKKNEISKKQTNTQDKSFARILDAAAHEDPIRQTTCELDIIVARCNAFGCWMFERLL